MMKHLALACCLTASFAFAQDAVAPAGFKPRPVTKGGDKKGVEELYKTCDELTKKGDWEGMAARVDFPVTMVTDNAAGVVSSSTWDKATWVESMKKAGADMPKDLKMSKKQKVIFLSDSLAMVEESNERTIGKQKDKWTSAALVVLKDGKWMFKSMIEGGWGDAMPPEKKADAAPAPAPKPAEKAPAAAPAKPAEPAKK